MTLQRFGSQGRPRTRCSQCLRSNGMQLMGTRLIIDCIADLHGFYPKLEGGDLLIVAGDLTARDLPAERLILLDWLANQDYKKKVWIAGNHDNSLVGMKFRKTRDDAAEYLCDSGTEFEGLKIWGSPWTTWFSEVNPHCTAFMLPEADLTEKWEMIPTDTDILITHSPPWTILDKNVEGMQVGSTGLMAHHINRLRPKLWVWGHIHEAYGQDGPYQWNNTKYVNASHVNEKYKPVNKPIRIIL